MRRNILYLFLTIALFLFVTLSFGYQVLNKSFFFIKKNTFDTMINLCIYKSFVFQHHVTFEDSSKLFQNIIHKNLRSTLNYIITLGLHQVERERHVFMMHRT